MSVMASAAAVASSSSDALATGRPVRSSTTVWKFSSASSRPWRDLRLIGGVRGVPGGALQDVPPDHRGRDRAVVAEADHRDGDGVARRERRAARPGPPVPTPPARRRTARPRGSPAAPRRRRGQRASRSPRVLSIVSTASGSGPMCRSAKPVAGVREAWGSAASSSTCGTGSVSERGGHGGSTGSVLAAADEQRQPVASPSVELRPAELSRVASLARSWRLRGSGENCPFGARHRPVPADTGSPVRGLQLPGIYHRSVAPAVRPSPRRRPAGTPP